MAISQLELNALHYEIGVVRQFGLKDVHKEGLSGNWAIAEDQHIWNDGPNVSLSLQVSTPKLERLVLRFEGRPFLGGQVTRQDITAYANGHRLGTWRMRESKSYEFAADIWPEHWFSSGNSKILTLSWHLPDAVSAKSIGGGSDIRELGFGFTSFSLLRG